MNRILYELAVLAAVTATLGAAEPGTPESRRIIAVPGPRTIQIGEAKIPGVVNGKNHLEIVVPEKSCAVVRYAAKILGETLKKSLNKDIPVVAKPTSGRTSLILGDNEYLRKAGFDVRKLDRDGFYLQGSGSVIFLAGVDDPSMRNPEKARSWDVFYERGTINAVLDFLERVIGVRFYFPGEIGTVIPKHKELMIPEMKIIDRPDKPRRRSGIGGKPIPGSNVSDKGSWYVVRNRLETFYVPNCHSLERLKFVERFGKTHPEYFGMDRNGKRYMDAGSLFYGNLCYTDPGFRNELYKDAVAFLKDEPAKSRGLRFWDPSALQKGFFNVMPKDHFQHCQCKRCLEYVKKHSEADLVWDLSFDIARRLEKAKIPGYVTSMSYGHYTAVPKGKLPRNLLIQVAVQGPWAENNRKKRDEADKRLKAWNKALGFQPWTWTYVGKYGGLDIKGVPASTPRTVGKYFKRTSKLSCGTFLEMETDYEIFNYLMHYMLGRVLWDSKCDVDAILTEHHKLMFGSGAKPMGQFFDRIEELWTKKIAGRIVETPLGPQAIAPADIELWGTIYSPEEFKFFDECFIKAKKNTYGMYLKRVLFFEKNFYGPLKRAAQNYAEQRKAVSRLCYEVKPLDTPAPKIDGKLDDAAWKKVKPTYLVPWDAKTEEVEVNTWFKIHRDEKNFYIAVRCDEPKMAKIVADKKGHDNPKLWQDSDIELFLNPSGDRTIYYQFIINSKGHFYDARIKKFGMAGQHDPKWESGAEIKTLCQKDGWNVEIRIPFAQLGKIDKEKFAANISRFRVLRSKVNVRFYSYSPYIRGFHDVDNYGIWLLNGDKRSSELVPNGDFSEKQHGRSFGQWFADQARIKDGTVALDKKIYRSAGQSIRIRNKNVPGLHWMTLYLPKLKADTEYEFAWSVKAENVKPDGKGYLGNGGGLVNFGSPKNNFYPKNCYQGTFPWTRESKVFRTEKDANKPGSRGTTYLRFGIINATGTLWFDDFSLREVKK